MSDKIQKRAVAKELVEYLKGANASKSINEVVAESKIDLKLIQLYVVLQELVKGGIVDYTEKRGRTKLYKLIPDAVTKMDSLVFSDEKKRKNKVDSAESTPQTNPQA